MRKLFKYILICIIVVLAIPSKQSSLSSLIKEYGYTDVVCTFYSSTKSDIDKVNKVENGNCVLYSCSIYDADNVEKQIKNNQGESVKFMANIDDYVKIKNKLLDKVCFAEELDGIKTVYGYNKKLSSSIKIDNNNVNIQIAFNGNSIVVGTPVILGSY